MSLFSHTDPVNPLLCKPATESPPKYVYIAMFDAVANAAGARQPRKVVKRVMQILDQIRAPKQFMA